MKTISMDPNVGMEISLFEELRAVVQQAGVPVEGTRSNALAYYVRANHNIYGDQYKVIIKQFIENLKEIRAQFGSQAACEISWTLDRVIQSLFKTEMIALSLSNPQLLRTINAVSGLYDACKSDNDKLHAAGKIVYFGGIPGDLEPEWYRIHFFNTL